MNQKVVRPEQKQKYIMHVNVGGFYGKKFQILPGSVRLWPQLEHKVSFNQKAISCRQLLMAH